jgi:hypothetical protein
MPLARVVSFEGVSSDRMAEMTNEIQSGDQPEGMNAKALLILHDADAEQALAIVIFENEDDYQRGDEILDSMPASDTPGRRTSVKKYDVALRMAP